MSSTVKKIYQWKDLDLKDLERMKRLESPDAPYPMDEILKCVRDVTWQRRRERLKGLTTRQKLLQLETYRMAYPDDYEVTVQIDNYLNALRRAGQLPPKGMV